MANVSRTHIPLDECVDRDIYEIRARNFTIGVFSAESKGFIGIREKLGDRYLFTEYHYDYSSTTGTALPLRMIGTVQDERIRLWERYPGSMCVFCGEQVEYRKELKSGYDRSIGGFPTWPWVHVDAKAERGCGRPDPITRGTYHPLFSLLERRSEGAEEDDEQS